MGHGRRKNMISRSEIDSKNMYLHHPIGKLERMRQKIVHQIHALLTVLYNLEKAN